MKLNSNFHTHTSRCGHACGADEDYVVSAINHKIKRLGFSDHVFLDGISQPGERGEISCLPEYLESISNLKKKYEGKIILYTGFEAEYSVKYIDYYRDLLKENKIDYLILGQHHNFDSDNWSYIGRFNDDHEVIKTYGNQVCEAIKSGLFLYIAHPDLYVTAFHKFDEVCVEIAHQICSCAEKYGIPLEINAHAYRTWEKHEKMIYPQDAFWEIASQYNVRVVIGYDAHNPNEFDGDLSFAEEVIERHNLKVLDIKQYVADYFKRIQLLSVNL